MDTILDALKKVIGFAFENPEVCSVLIGPAAAWCLLLIVERFLMPTADDQDHRRRQRGAILLGCWLVGGAFSAALWWAAGGRVGLGPRLVICFIGALVLTFVYPIVAKLATDMKPSIGSAFRRDAGP